MRRFLGGLFWVILTVGFAGQLTHDYKAWPLWIAAGGLGLMWLLWGPLTSYILPRVEITRGAASMGWTVQISPPQKRTRGRLKRETFLLAKEMRSSAKPTQAQRFRDHFDLVEKVEATQNEVDRHKLWSEGTASWIGEMDQERHELGSLFGGRLSALLAEYQRLGVINSGDAEVTRLYAESYGALTRAASELEALAKRL